MQTQKSLWYTFSLSARTRSTIDISFFLNVNTEAGEDQCPNVKTVRQRERILSYSTFYSIQAFNRLDNAHHFRRAICFIKSTNSNVNLIQKHLHRHTQDNV